MVPERNLSAWRSTIENLNRDEQRERWRGDPVAWVKERLKEHVWSKQEEILRSVRDHRLTAVQSSHGVGKSFALSRVVGFYLDNYPAGDFVVITTAPTWNQVKAVLWRYIGQMVEAHELPGYVTQNAQWKIGNELVAIGRKPADRNEQGFQGIHGRKGIIGVIDEASGVDDQIWNALDSMASTNASRIIAIGNPDSISSRFNKVCTGQERNWNRIHISSYDAPWYTGEVIPEEMAEGLVDAIWVQDKVERWGEESAIFKIKVLGEFADLDESAVIPMPWIRAANQRWLDWQDLSLEEREASPIIGRQVLGVDVGHKGADKTVIVTRQGHHVSNIEQWSKRDTVAVAGLVKDRLILHPRAVAVVDAIGIGAGVVDQLRHMGQKVVPFVSSAATRRRDATGTQGFNNSRSAAYWHLRELLDPAMGARLAFPPNDDLLRDLSVPRYEVIHGGRIKIESKDDIKKRLGHSPDLADALVYAFWIDHVERDYPEGRQGLRGGSVPYTSGGWDSVYDHRNNVAPPARARIAPRTTPRVAGSKNRAIAGKSLFTGHF
jgi:hypothetical protein